MCIITDEIKDVTNTEILVCKNQKEQLTVYSNKTLNFTPNNFMVLPVPVDVSDVIRFIDLTGIDVFSKLQQLFKPKQLGGLLSARSYNSDNDVEYHSVGSYDVFVCKNLQAIVNNFSVDNRVIQLLGKYYGKNYAFLLCKLKNGEEYKYHPLAYIHQLRDQRELFIPTKHLHIHRQGDQYEKNYERWDHHIYVYNYSGNLSFKNQVLIGIKDEIARIVEEYKNENYFNLLGDIKPNLKFEENVKVVSTIGLPKIDFNHDKVNSVNRFIIKNTFLNDDLTCSVY